MITTTDVSYLRSLVAPKGAGGLIRACLSCLLVKVRYNHGQGVHLVDWRWHDEPPGSEHLLPLDDWGVEWTSWVLLSDVARQIQVRYNHYAGDP